MPQMNGSFAAAVHEPLTGQRTQLLYYVRTKHSRIVVVGGEQAWYTDPRENRFLSVEGSGYEVLIVPGANGPSLLKKKKT